MVNGKLWSYPHIKFKLILPLVINERNFITNIHIAQFKISHNHEIDIVMCALVHKCTCKILVTPNFTTKLKLSHNFMIWVTHTKTEKSIKINSECLKLQCPYSIDFINANSFLSSRLSSCLGKRARLPSPCFN